MDSPQSPARAGRSKKASSVSAVAISSPAHRHTLRVPLVDTSVEAWWAAQDDPSASVRALIREEIMRNGFTDTVNRPVTQLPRRGRPPLTEDLRDGDSMGDVPAANGTTGGTTVGPSEAAPLEDAGGLVEALQDGLIPAPSLQPQSGSAGPLDMEDIFGHRS